MDSMNTRFKQLRLACKKTQTEMGKALGLSKSGISEIEAGRRSVTEQHLIMLSNWKEFPINIEWLKTGSGGDNNMFLKPKKNDLVTKAAQLLGEHDAVFEAFVATYSQLTPSNRKVLLEFGIDFLKNLDIPDPKD